MQPSACVQAIAREQARQEHDVQMVRFRQALARRAAQRTDAREALGWVIPTADGVDSPVDVPDEIVARVTAGLLGSEIAA